MQKKYRALVNITVDGVPFLAGDVITNATAGHVESMLRQGQCEAIQEALPAAPKAAPSKKEKRDGGSSLPT